MARLALGVFAFAVAVHGAAPVAEACGGFFCGRMPVDQTAERIVFKVNEDTTTMIVQIAYSGAAEDFAWVLPLGTVPAVDSLAVFPQRALTALDANTGPQFMQPSDCPLFRGVLGTSCPVCAGAASPQADADSGVTVHYRAEVGPYDVAAIESEDPMALYDWLRDNDFNVNEPMLPYIRAYTDEGMKFIALKLQRDAATSDIQPFRFDLPGTSPSIPLRMTALAAEPEMSLLVFVFGAERYSGANWPDVVIPDDRIVWRADNWPLQTNWTALVAKGVDEAGGQGWVTELAGSTESIVQLLDNSVFNTPEDQMAAVELRALIGDAGYVSRLYSRLSAEEMQSDPIFRRDDGGDVSNLHMLSRYVDDVDQCPDPSTPPPYDPCLFTSCGAGGICRPVELDGMEQPVAGCGCVDGASARTTFDPVAVSLQADGSLAPAATVVCQDARMSFVNPGDAATTGGTMPDPCQTFDCGANGECLAINMTPTCVCDRGFVALGSFAADGTRSTRCEQPTIAVPDEFYRQRLPDLPQELPGGRVMEIDPMRPVVEPEMDDLGSNGMPVPSDDDSEQAGAGAPPQAGEDPQPNAIPGSGNQSGAGEGADDGCAVSAPGVQRGRIVPALLALLGVTWLRRRRRTG